MQAFPTRATFHVALAGIVVLSVGVAVRMPVVVAFGGAIVLAVAVGRALSLIAITRLRTGGFEMVWTTPRRVFSAPAGGEVVLTAELRNRGPEEVRGVRIRALVSSMIQARMEPETIDLPREGAVHVDLILHPLRVGRWGIHGVALEVRGVAAGGEGLYEIPLLFANPLGLEVLPRHLHLLATGARGGRSRHMAEAGASANQSGEGDELRELRDHVPGDPFKRIAWKASARRGRLLVREMERQERDIVWMVIDGSVELWAGAPGTAPLDRILSEVAGLAARHLGRGDKVGLGVVCSRLRAWLPAMSGPKATVALSRALLGVANLVDIDRTELSEDEVAQRVVEHARPLDPEGLADLPRGDLDALARRAETLRTRAPFAPRIPHAHSDRDRAFRRYLAAFGIEVPPRLDGERRASESTLALALGRLVTERPRPSIVHVWSPVPPSGSEVWASVQKLRRRGVEIRWTPPDFAASLGSGAPVPDSDLVRRAVLVRADAARIRGERALRSRGVHLARLGPRP